MGMTRFRDVLDDMPIVGYGWSALFHNRLQYFHTLLAGHAANYLSRGTYWGTEQRAQVPVIPGQTTRNGGTGGEHGSLCMVSAISTSMWIRWMLVQDDPDENVVYLARGAPRRWYQQDQPFGISDAPTRFGLVSYSLKARPGPQIFGSVQLRPNPGTIPSKLNFQVAVHVRSPDSNLVLKDVKVSGATLITLHTNNETVVFSSGSSFSFNASFH